MGNPISWVEDAADTVGDFVGDVADFGGDVIGSIGDVVEDIDPATLAKIAYTVYTGDPSLAFEDMGEEALADAVINEVGDYATDPSNWMDYLDTGNIGSDVLTDVGSDAFDASSFLPGNNPYDPIKDIGNYTRYAKDAYSLYNQLNPDQQSQVRNQYQQQGFVDPNSTSGSIDFGSFIPALASLGSGLGLFGSNAGNTSPLNLGNILSLAKGFGSGMGDVIAGIGNIAKDPLTVSGILGGLTYYDQKRINDLIQQGYDTNQAKQLAAQQKFTTPEGIASLPQQNITGLTPRTTADVVSRPKAAKGGSINDLYNEYSMLNNRMRNYRRLARGGLI